MNETVFFRLFAAEDKATALLEAIDAQHDGTLFTAVYEVNPVSFWQVPGSPFAYWVSDKIRRTFTELPPFEGSERAVRAGLQTSDDFQFVRIWWEVESENLVGGNDTMIPEQFREKTFTGGRWIPFAKGGDYSPYYSELYLVINWEYDGKSLKEFAVTIPGNAHWSRSIRSDSYYFRPGLTWTPRTIAGLSFRALPTGCAFANKGPAAFASEDLLYPLLAILNGTAFAGFVSLQMAFGSYEVGVIQRTPVPDLNNPDGVQLGELARTCVDLKRNLDTANETSHVFYLPALLQGPGATLVVRQAAWQARLDDVVAQLAAHQRTIDNIAFRLYGINDEDRRAIEESLGGASTEDGAPDSETEVASPEAEEEVEEVTPPTDPRALALDLLSYAVGCVVGRWDVRYALAAEAAFRTPGAAFAPPELPDPFAPLPVCSPGMLIGADGLLLRETPPGYPLLIDPDGILVDDPDHDDDLLRRVRAVLALLWGAQADAREGELAAALGVRDLRDFLRRGFFDAHLRRYSKSRRKAPIYWLLQSPRKLYGLWLYYPRLDPDTLFKALTLYVEPKVTRESHRLDELRALAQAAGTAGREAKQAAVAVDRQEQLLTDLQEFRDRLSRAAHLYLRPDLNDGVLLTIAPLHALVPWREARTAWDALLAGKYAWSSIGAQLREKGIVKGEA